MNRFANSGLMSRASRALKYVCLGPVGVLLAGEPHGRVVTCGATRSQQPRLVGRAERVVQLSLPSGHVPARDGLAPTIVVGSVEGVDPFPPGLFEVVVRLAVEVAAIAGGVGVQRPGGGLLGLLGVGEHTLDLQAERLHLLEPACHLVLPGWAGRHGIGDLDSAGLLHLQQQSGRLLVDQPVQLLLGLVQALVGLVQDLLDPVGLVDRVVELLADLLDKGAAGVGVLPLPARVVERLGDAVDVIPGFLQLPDHRRPVLDGGAQRVERCVVEVLVGQHCSAPPRESATAAAKVSSRPCVYLAACTGREAVAEIGGDPGCGHGRVRS
jgi:hypothetical protein